MAGNCLYCSEHLIVLQLTGSDSIGFLLFHCSFFSKRHLCYFVGNRPDRRVRLKLMYHSLYHHSLVTSVWFISFWPYCHWLCKNLLKTRLFFYCILFFSKSDYKIMHIYAMINETRSCWKYLRWMSFHISLFTWLVTIVLSGFV